MRYSAHVHDSIYTIAVSIPYRTISVELNKPPTGVNTGRLTLAALKLRLTANAESMDIGQHTGKIPYFHGDVSFPDLTKMECDRRYDIFTPLTITCRDISSPRVSFFRPRRIVYTPGRCL